MHGAVPWSDPWDVGARTLHFVSDKFGAAAQGLFLFMLLLHVDIFLHPVVEFCCRLWRQVAAVGRKGAAYGRRMLWKLVCFTCTALYLFGKTFVMCLITKELEFQARETWGVHEIVHEVWIDIATAGMVAGFIIMMCQWHLFYY